MQQEKPMPNAIIAAGTAIFIGSAHLHHRQDNEEEDVAAVEGITEA